ncbi:hypothetical protein [Cryobacterium sp. Sr3]|uniref:hypothetical protein n=1 Tax=Cryobacterium sp. Sr3 TaxID=1259194 RepID=UPI00106D08EE|nr:hypothetical protein [Cryobacterium sp. Sr3]TFB53432.1 hypothetical protein E3N94_14695 [Cryobacterium sp. Sr3]
MSRQLRVSESLVVSKTGWPGESEDIVADGPAFLVVCDGATDKSGLTFNGLSGGRVVAEIVCKVIAAAAAGTPGVELVRRINLSYEERLGSKTRGREVGDLPAASFCAVDKIDRRVIRVGDCSWRSVERVEMGGKRVDEISGDARAALLSSLLRSGVREEVLRADDPGRQMVLPLIRAQAFWRNNPEPGSLCHGAIDGRKVPDSFIEEWQLEDDEHELAVASDGYPDLLMTLRESEDCLRQDLLEDPLRIGRHRTTKGVMPGNLSFDDRAFVRLIDSAASQS